MARNGVVRRVRQDNMDRFTTLVQELNRKVVKVGIFGEGDSQMLMIATVNEFGCNISVTPKMRNYLHANGLHLKKGTKNIRIPERNFFRGGIQAKQRNIQSFIEGQLEKLFTFRISLNQFYNSVGQYAAQSIQEYLTDLRVPPNHPFTLERKKPKTNPLINTGHLRESITYKIESR